MATLRDIRDRIKSVKNTQQITKAMKMVSAAKLRRAQENIEAARPYAKKMLEIITDLASRTSPESHPLLAKETKNKAEVILMTSDRGLCGGFNTSLIKNAERFINKFQGSGGVSLNLIGKRGVDFYKRRDTTVAESSPFTTKKSAQAFAAELAKKAIDNYLNDKTDEVYLVYSEFQSVLTQIPTLQRLLPIPSAPEKDEEESQKSVYTFEPSEEGVLESILPKYVEVQIFRALLESSASEHGARMTAMDSASRNASDMIGALTLFYNRARQADITKELLEIIGGAEALKD